MRDRWRVAVLDSGLADPAAAPVSCRFVDTGREVVKTHTLHDPMGHGTEVARAICAADLLIGQVLDHRGLTTAAALAAAILWSLEEGADLIHMSLGLSTDRPVLATAVEKAVKAGCIVVASAPARGECTFPARYPHVIRATSDARCDRDEISALNSIQADFGGCPRQVRTQRLGGASIGAAHLTRFLVERIAPGSDLATVRSELGAMARYRGVEAKRA